MATTVLLNFVDRKVLRRASIILGQSAARQAMFTSLRVEFMEAGKKRLSGDTMREANTDEVKGLRRESRDLKEVVAEQALELRLLKKSMSGHGGDDE